jgi:transposase
VSLVGKTKLHPKKKSLTATERDEVARAAFRTKMSELDPTKLVVLDESGTHISLTPLYGYAPRGQRLVGRVPRNRGKSLTLICALTLQGVKREAVLTFEGGTDKLAFETYIEQSLVPNLVKGQIVLLDNLGAHKTKRVRELIEGCGCQLLFLPPYSPDFSPIELMFNKLKGYLRQVSQRTKDALLQAIGDGLQLVTPQDARAWFTHCGFSLPAL